MIVFSFCFVQVFVSEILNAQVVCFLTTDLVPVIAIAICVSINADKMKTFEKSQYVQ